MGGKDDDGLADFFGLFSVGFDSDGFFALASPEDFSAFFGFDASAGLLFNSSIFWNEITQFD